MIRNISIDDFLSTSESVPLIDVRTSAEFVQGHVPGAFNLPLFSNEERIQVGTTYKQVGREAAILLGFDLTGSKWSGFIKDALIIAPGKRVAVHCWRGGMRSGAMAWALNLYGFDVLLIAGGYKKYRSWVHQRFEINYNLVILGGMTGSGKTRLLYELQSKDEQMIDLEGLAQHQGSSYGSMNKLVQPTQEQFENNLAGCLKDCSATRRIWIEDESLTIGKRVIPQMLWQQMRAAILVDLHVPVANRAAALAAEYGVLDAEFLSESTQRIHKRLGPVQTKDAILAIQENRMVDFITIVLVYYDKVYRAGLNKRDQAKVYAIELPHTDFAENAGQILKFTNAITTQHAR